MNFIIFMIFVLYQLSSIPSSVPRGPQESWGTSGGMRENAPGPPAPQSPGLEFRGSRGPTGPGPGSTWGPPGAGKKAGPLGTGLRGPEFFSIVPLPLGPLEAPRGLPEGPPRALCALAPREAPTVQGALWAPMGQKALRGP